MAQTSAKGTGQQQRNDRQALLDLVREGCETLLATHPSVVESLTVSRVFDDGESARLGIRMAMHLAEEYNLDADIRKHSAAVVVRLSRNSHHIHLRRGHGDTT